MYVQTNERWSSAYYALSGVFAAVTLQGSPEAICSPISSPPLTPLPQSFRSPAPEAGTVP